LHFTVAVRAKEHLDRIAKLSNRLKEVMEEAEQIRSKIERIATHRALWPERQALSEALDRSDGKLSSFQTPTLPGDADQN